MDKKTVEIATSNLSHHKKIEAISLIFVHDVSRLLGEVISLQALKNGQGFPLPVRLSYLNGFENLVKVVKAA